MSAVLKPGGHRPPLQITSGRGRNWRRIARGWRRRRLAVGRGRAGLVAFGRRILALCRNRVGWSGLVGGRRLAVLRRRRSLILLVGRDRRLALVLRCGGIVGRLAHSLPLLADLVGTGGFVEGGRRVGREILPRGQDAGTEDAPAALHIGDQARFALC